MISAVDYYSYFVQQKYNSKHTNQTGKEII